MTQDPTAIKNLVKAAFEEPEYLADLKSWFAEDLPDAKVCVGGEWLSWAEFAKKEPV